MIKPLQGQGQGYLVFHQAYLHFEHRYGLVNLGAILSHGEVAPGAKSVRHLQHLIEDGKVRCVFTEPQFDRKLAQSIVGDSGVRVAELDPMGQNIEAGPEHYFKLVRCIIEYFITIY